MQKICAYLDNKILISFTKSDHASLKDHYSKCSQKGHPRVAVIPNKMLVYTVRPLFKKFTQHCETYEPTNCCVKKIHNLCKIFHNLCKIVHKLCNFFTQLLVGSYVSQCCVKF